MPEVFYPVSHLAHLSVSDISTRALTQTVEKPVGQTFVHLSKQALRLVIYVSFEHQLKKPCTPFHPFYTEKKSNAIQ